LPRTLSSELLQSTVITYGISARTPSPADPGKMRAMAAAAAAADLLPAFSAVAEHSGGERSGPNIFSP
jgi:hypothetical protein